jgi:hypothetical protein
MTSLAAAREVWIFKVLLQALKYRYSINVLNLPPLWPSQAFVGWLEDTEPNSSLAPFKQYFKSPSVDRVSDLS